MKSLRKLLFASLATAALGICPAFAAPVVSGPTLFGDTSLTTLGSTGGALEPYQSTYNVVSTGNGTGSGGLSQSDFYSLIGSSATPSVGLTYSGYYFDVTGIDLMGQDTFTLAYTLLTNDPTAPLGDFGYGFVDLNTNSPIVGSEAPFLGGTYSAAGTDGYSNAYGGVLNSPAFPLGLFGTDALRVFVYTDFPTPVPTQTPPAASALAFSFQVNSVPEIDTSTAAIPVALCVGFVLLLGDRRRRSYLN